MYLLLCWNLLRGWLLCRSDHRNICKDYIILLFLFFFTNSNVGVTASSFLCFIQQLSRAQIFPCVQIVSVTRLDQWITTAMQYLEFAHVKTDTRVTTATLARLAVQHSNSPESIIKISSLLHNRFTMYVLPTVTRIVPREIFPVFKFNQTLPPTLALS